MIIRPWGSLRLARLIPAAVVAACLPATSAVAQEPPPIRGTISLEGTTNAVYGAARVIIVATAEGARHVYRVTRDLVVHGPKGPSPLESLREGTAVAVHFTVAPDGATAIEIDQIGDDGLAITEGVVIGLDHRRREIRLRLASGRVETLRLTTRAAAEQSALNVAEDGTVRVIVYYTDDNGRKVVHYFRQVS